MQVIKAVVLDLTTFAIDAIKSAAHNLLPARQEPLALPDGRTNVADPVQEPVSVVRNLEEAIAPAGSYYFAGEGERTLYMHPTVTFDGAVKVVPYGEKVLVHSLEGRFASVTIGSRSGWMLKDVLYSESDRVLPQFVVGSTYGSDSTETKKLRFAINDEFLGGAVRAPLSASEYVTYRLWKAGKQLPWGETRPRLPGSWQRLLKGAAGIYSGVSPKTGSVMEYLDDEVAALAFVDAVAPDETIRISMIAEDDDSRYLEQELSKDSWRELRPVFISVL